MSKPTHTGLYYAIYLLGTRFPFYGNYGKHSIEQRSPELAPDDKFHGYWTRFFIAQTRSNANDFSPGIIRCQMSEPFYEGI